MSDWGRGVELDTGQRLVIQRSSHGWHVEKGASYQNVQKFHVENTPAGIPGGEVPQSPEEMMPRIVSALQHAVSLCQSVYKTPVQAKEPF